MADTLAANVAEITQELIAATVRLMPQNAPLMTLSERIRIPKGRNSVEIPRVNSTFSVQTPTEGDDIVTSSQFDLTSTTISPTLRVIKVRISERARYFSQEDILALVSDELSRAEGQDLDTDLSAEFANFGQTITNTGGTDLALADLREARRLLMANAVANGGPAPDPIVAVLAPVPVEHLLTNVGVTGAVANANPWIPAGLSEQFIKTYFVNGVSLVGVPIFWDGYITANGSGDWPQAMFSKKALQYAVSKDWDMKQFEESEFVGVIVRTVADYNSGVGKFANWGVRVTTDA